MCVCLCLCVSVCESRQQFIRCCEVDHPDLFTLGPSCELGLWRDGGRSFLLGCFVFVSLVFVFIHIQLRSRAASPALHNNTESKLGFIYTQWAFVKLQYEYTEVKPEWRSAVRSSLLPSEQSLPHIVWLKKALLWCAHWGTCPGQRRVQCYCRPRGRHVSEVLRLKFLQWSEFHLNLTHLNYTSYEP